MVNLQQYYAEEYLVDDPLCSSAHADSAGGHRPLTGITSGLPVVAEPSVTGGFRDGAT